MRFVFTLVVPSRQNNLVQEVIGEYPATSLNELYAHIHKGQRWFMITLMYQQNDKWVERGPLLINSDWCGKIKLFVDNDRY